MSNRYIDIVLQHSATSGTERLVMLCIANRTDTNGVCFPGNESLAKDANMSSRNIIRLLKLLNEKGEISITDNGITGRGNKRELTILLPVKGDNSVTLSDREKGDKLGKKGDKLGNERVTNPVKKGDTVVTITNITNKNNHSNQNGPGGGGENNSINVVELYESNIGLLSPIIAEKLHALMDEYPPTWIEHAIKIACENNVRKLTYVTAILDRWRVSGKQDKAKPKDGAMSVLDLIAQQGGN